MKTFDLTLSEPIKYHTGGSETEGMMLELTAPSVKNRKKVARLKQDFIRAVTELQGGNEDKISEEKEKKKGDDELDPKGVLVILQGSSIDYEAYVDTFVSLLISGICKIDGKEPLTGIRVDNISFDDMERMLGEYLVNFILGSLGE